VTADRPNGVRAASGRTWVQTERMSSRATGSRRFIPNSPFASNEPAEVAETYEVGDQVCHDRHGLGRVIEKTGASELVADFGSTVRRISLPSTKLTKL
jgi:hypothetical protein